LRCRVGERAEDGGGRGDHAARAAPLLVSRIGRGAERWRRQSVGAIRTRSTSRSITSGELADDTLDGSGPCAYLAHMYCPVVRLSHSPMMLGFQLKNCTVVTLRLAASISLECRETGIMYEKESGLLYSPGLRGSQALQGASRWQTHSAGYLASTTIGDSL
jgi:hypothetical protein